MYIACENIVIRPLGENDFPLLFKWLTDERVLAFYGGRNLHYTPETLREHYEEPFEGEGYRVMIEYCGIPIGYGQIYAVCGALFDEYRYPDTGRTVYAMDQFIGEVAYQNRGIGTQYCKAVCSYLRQYRTIRGSCLDGTSACIFSVIRHKNSSQRGDYAREFLFRLTKNLSAHLYHQNCAVLP